MADAVEALIGAIYIDAGDEVCKERVLSWYASRLQSIDVDRQSKDAKTRLQEYLQSRKKPLPVYEVILTTGEAHDQEFTVSCQIPQLKEVMQAVAGSRKAAEQKVAAMVLEALGV